MLVCHRGTDGWPRSFCGTPKRASTVQSRVRPTESYALVRSIKHIHNGISFFRANSCSRRITNILSVVERFDRKPLCSSGRIPTRSQYSLRRRAIIFSNILPACATSATPLKSPHSVRSLFLWSTTMMAFFHCHSTSPPLRIRTPIFYRDAFGTRTLRQPMPEFYLLAFSSFPLPKSGW